MLYTDNIRLKKPAYSEPADIADINENSDIIDREFGNRYLKSETYSVEQVNNAIAQAIEALPNGLVYRGAVNYYKDLPTANNKEGDTYSVKYQGETGTTADGNEYAWGEYEGTLQWIKLGVNAYSKDEIDEQLSDVKSDILINRETIGTQIIKKNLFDISAFEKIVTYAARGTILYANNGFTLSATGNDCFTVKYDSTGYRIPVLPNTTYTLSWTADSDTAGTIMIFPNGIQASPNIYAYNDETKKLTFTTKSNIEYVTVRFGVKSTGTSITYSNIQIEEGTVATEYEPYKPSLQEQIDALVAEIAELKANQTTVSE